MAIVKTVKVNNVGRGIRTNDEVKIQLICPVCKKEKQLPIRKSIIDQSKQLLTISIPKNKICPHHFQAFIDKNYKVRGYQKVDFTFEPEDQPEKKEIIRNFLQQDYDLFKNLILKGNTLEYNPNGIIKKKIESNNNNNSNSKYQKIQQNMKSNDIMERDMSLEEIYEEFWDFIDEHNQEFRELIIKDPRRSKQLVSK